ncbi:MAG: choice-of-anchor tandem repeat GloVer-containing protein [Rhizomicrobium sp.]|jgi:uncharacterized repeat protein (TIGR03803 family)
MLNFCDTMVKCIFGSALALAAFAPLDAAHATKKESVLYSFCSQPNCSDGSNPVAGLIADSSGNLYGTASQGGSTACGNGCGVVFKITPGGTETVLHAFTGGDGQYADSSLIMDSSGNLYGTTATGGGQGNCNMGCGVAFKIAPNGTETVLHAFTGGNDGGYPGGALIADAQGNLYGLATAGGSNCTGFGCGVLFKITPGGTESVLYSFCAQPACADGANPVGGLTADTHGNFFGVTGGGSTYGDGVVFEYAANGTETALYAFTDGTDGGIIQSGVIADKAGNLYGTATSDGAYGAGNVYKVAPSGTETVLYSFCAQPNCADGANSDASVIFDGKGNLYGTTDSGGASDAGAVFELAPNGKETVLHSFSYSNGDGASPEANLLKIKGELYGTTSSGGANSGGTVFKLKK